MADKCTETPSSKFISDIEENAIDHFKMINSTPQENNSTIDEYEKEFERVMQEQEKEINQRYAKTVTHKLSVSAATSGDESFIHIDCAPCELNPIQTPNQGKNSSELSRNKSSVSAGTSGEESFIHNDRNKSSVPPATCGDNWYKPPTQTTTKIHTQGLGNSELFCNESSQVDYPPELNPFSDDETERGKNTNPFIHSDDEENTQLIQEISPKPRPRHSFSTETNFSQGLEHRNRLPVPLPRTASRSMPTTPNQSPLLHLNRSFYLQSPSTSTYNSIRRKKRPAPHPPNQPLSNSLQSPIASPKTNNRPRKNRLAPPPPKLDTTRHQQATTLSQINPSKELNLS